MNIRKRFRKHPELHTGALNDILFILLLFFLIVSTLANPNVKKVTNPQGKSDSKAKQNIVVSIDKENKMYLGQHLIPMDSLEAIIMSEATKNKAFTDTPYVVINADTISMTGSFFRVMNAAEAAGCKIVANVKK